MSGGGIIVGWCGLLCFNCFVGDGIVVVDALFVLGLVDVVLSCGLLWWLLLPCFVVVRDVFIGLLC